MGNTYFNNKQIKDIFLNSQRFKKMYLGMNVIWDFLINAFSSFKSRVLGDGGTFENDNSINDLTAALLQEASLVITPNGVKTSKLYAIKPEDGSGDLTVTRATTATRINASGIIETVPTNTARIDYSTGKGLILVEPQRTNLLLHSNNFINSPWGTVNSPIITSLPDEQTPYGKGAFILGVNTISARIQQSSTFNNTFQSVSVYIKADSLNSAFKLGTSAFDGGVTIKFTDGVLSVLSSIRGTYSILTLKNGWYRLMFSLDTIVAINSFIQLIINSGSVKLCHAQSEIGTSSTSYIPTTTSSVTRNADVISKYGLNGITSITETFENGTTNVISGNPTSYTMSQGRIKQVIGL